MDHRSARRTSDNERAIAGSAEPVVERESSPDEAKGTRTKKDETEEAS
jgi:hypothetical protein